MLYEPVSRSGGAVALIASASLTLPVRRRIDDGHTP